MWTFPKGRPERGESPEQAALREVVEETGIEAKIDGLVPGVFVGDTSTTVFFRMSVVHVGSLESDSETQAIRWATPDEARALIAETKSTRGRRRDIDVLEAALAMIGLAPG